MNRPCFKSDKKNPWNDSRAKRVKGEAVEIFKDADLGKNWKIIIMSGIGGKICWRFLQVDHKNIIENILNSQNVCRNSYGLNKMLNPYKLSS